MQGLIAKILGILASYAGLLFLVHPAEGEFIHWYKEFSLFETLGFWVSFVLIGFVIVSEVRSFLKAKGKLYPKGDKGISRYMHNWISKGGRVAIFSRDMTWAKEDSEPKMYALLKRKASDGELDIFVPQSNDLTDELETNGARLHSYEHLGISPRSRFTIIHWGQQGSRMAVGRPVGDSHYIQEYSEGEDPAFAIAADLLEFIQKQD